MSNISEWSTSAASNQQASPDGWPEGMPPASVNDAARENMAAVARWYGDTDGTLTTAGSGNSFTLTTNSSFTALADISLLVFRVDRANTGAATLAVDGLTAKSMRNAGSALISGQLVADTIVAASYNATADAFDIHTVPKIDAADLVGEIADARLSANVPLLDAADNSFEGTLTLARANTILYFDATSAGADERIWRFVTLSADGSFSLEARTDADATGSTPIELRRSGTTIAEIAFLADSITANGSEVLTPAEVAAATNIDVSGLSATDSIYVNDSGVAKRMDVQDMGSRIIASATQTLALGDANATHVNTTANNHTITIPPNSSVAFPVGSEMAFLCQSTGTITLAAGVGVSIVSLSSKLTVSASGGGAYLQKTGTDTWQLAGNIE